MMSHDRAEALTLLDGMLSKEIDLITVQLSENVSDLTTFEADFKELISYIQSKASNAEILVIGDIWDKEIIDKIKIKVCEETEVKFLSLDEIKDLDKFQCGMNTIVFDNDGNPHMVEHEGVAKHPGDIGMKLIADLIVKVVLE